MTFSPIKSALFRRLFITGFAIASAVFLLLYLLMDKPPQHCNALVTYEPLSIRFYPLYKNKRTHFQRIIISEIGPSKTLNQMWSIKPSSGNSKINALESLTYGTIPAGWVEFEHPKIIQNNKRYRITFVTDTGSFDVDVPSKKDQNGTGWRMQR